MNRGRLPSQQSGGVLLNGYPGDRVVIACERCNRRGEYAIETLYARHGSLALPELRKALANCPNLGNMSDPCQAHFPALKPEPPALPPARRASRTIDPADNFLFRDDG